MNLTETEILLNTSIIIIWTQELAYKKCYNTAKGQTLDIDSKRLSHRIALNIFKDFSTGYYQITIGCNDTMFGMEAVPGIKEREISESEDI